MKIKAEDLRIGNLLTFYNVPITVLGVSKYRIEFEDSHEKAGYSMILNDNFKPVPLSGEPLIELGFAKSHDHNGDTYHILSEDGFGVIFTVEHWNKVKKDSKWNNHWHIRGLLKGHKIEYIHQLQNLYFALTGEELKINP